MAWMLIGMSCASTSASGPAVSPGATVSTDAAEGAPLGQLPEGVTPLHYALHLDLDPRRDRFTGEAHIRTQLDGPQSHIWLHAKDLEVSAASVQSGETRVLARFSVVDAETGLARLDVEGPVGPGEVTLKLAYQGAFDRNLQGLYKVVHGEESYAFTQFESHFARQCFPGFDEPRFKTPYDIRVTTRGDDVVITTTAEVERKDTGDGRIEHVFATTAPLPTYLLALAVGPLDVVDPGALPAAGVRKTPLPFRGVAVKGKGPQLRYALEHTRPLLEALEAYFGRPYPFQKLDIIAVPDFASGAMENVGAVTFREVLLLLDEQNAPVEQRKGFASVMAHELAHMWFGNLVTMPWWDDIWLNEAFATWMAAKVVQSVHPEYDGDVALQERVIRAMGQDSLLSARQIRQPIESTHDIRNAFDGITYSKGGGVLGMFERYLGEKTFREGLRRYMDRHAYGSATYRDLLNALSQAAEQDVATPFETFLFQPGLPAISAAFSCDDRPVLTLAQQRFLPVGSAGQAEQSWQIPVCARYGRGDEVTETCALLRRPQDEIPLDFCPEWVMPNAGGTGYYRFSLPGPQLEALLRRGRAYLSTREKLAIADALSGAIVAATLPADEVFARVPVLAAEQHRAVVLAPLPWLDFAQDELVAADARPQVQAFAQAAYRPVVDRLGLSPKDADEAADVRQLRSAVVGFLALDMGDRALLERAAALGKAYLGYGGDGALHPEAIEPSLVPTALAAAIRVEGAPFFDAALAHLEQSENALLRGQLIGAMARATEPALAARARALATDPRLRGNERLSPLFGQSRQVETREATWTYLRDHYDSLVELLPNTHLGAMPYLAGSACSPAAAEEVEAFFSPRIASLPGGPRNLAAVVESIRLCGARVQAHRASARAFFANSSVASLPR